MEAMGYTIKVENLGRIVIPFRLRRKMGISLQDSLEMYVENDQIIIRKYQPACVFCDGTRGLKNYRDTIICEACLKELKQKSAP